MIKICIHAFKIWNFSIYETLSMCDLDLEPCPRKDREALGHHKGGDDDDLFNARSIPPPVVPDIQPFKSSLPAPQGWVNALLEEQQVLQCRSFSVIKLLNT